MDVHDTPSISRSIECKPGVVITVEPGIYVRSDNAAVREEFKGLPVFFHLIIILLKALDFALKMMCF